MSNANKIKTLQDQLNRSAGTLSKVAASKVTASQLIKIALNAAMRNSTLLQCDARSIVRAVMQGAELGLVPGSALNQAYLVPFKNKSNGTWEAQLIISAQGLAELAYRSGMVTSITVECVYRGDVFEFEQGLNPKLRHIPAGETDDPKDITHAYTVVTLKDGAQVFKVMTRSQIDRIMKKSPSVKSGSMSPWTTDYEEMARKTVAKNAFKYVPKSIEVAKAAALDSAQQSEDWSDVEFEIPEAMPDLPEEIPSAVQALESKIAERTGDLADEEDFELSGDDE